MALLTLVPTLSAVPARRTRRAPLLPVPVAHAVAFTPAAGDEADGRLPLAEMETYDSPIPMENTTGVLAWSRPR